MDTHNSQTLKDLPFPNHLFNIVIIYVKRRRGMLLDHDPNKKVALIEPACTEKSCVCMIGFL